MRPASSSPVSPTSGALTVPEFIDRKRVVWAQVKHAYHTLYQSFSYRYPGPIRDLSHELMVTPRAVYGGQELRRADMKVTPPLNISEHTDPFGNMVLSVKAEVLETGLEFCLLSTVKNSAGKPPVHLSEKEVAPFREVTPLTAANPKMRGVAGELRATYTGTLAFAAKLNEWVYHAMRYGFGVTGTRTPAAAALTGGVGLCQDYAHIMVAMCRAVGVPARYVSGHMLGEGGSHAWAEVFVPEAGAFAAYGFDPTNRRRPGLDYVVVALGRDYSDVPPTAGSFNAPYNGELSCVKRAGLTRVEYYSGELLGNEPPDV